MSDPRAWIVRLTVDLGRQVTEADEALRPEGLPDHARLAYTNAGLAWTWEDASGHLLCVLA